MKLADRTVETHSSGVRGANQFSIAQTSKMFKILSDSLYSDKVMAVVRELCTNAHDAHVAAGNKNPFKVTLPTQANPSFIVRDYGTGLSQQDMEELYTTYGASNKNTSNDFVGCLGLGSKSPFAYTKSFTTSSYWNGTKFTYIAAIDESGVPTLNLLGISETNEPNGLEISFAVKNYDFAEFTQKAVRVFHYFKMKPIVEGGYGVDFSKTYSNTNIVISGDGWRVCRINNDSSLFPNNYHKVNAGVIAIMGNIAYPVDSENIIGQEKAEVSDNIQRWNRAFQKADIDNWKNFVREIMDSGLYLELDFGIGELEMDVSREGLQYTKQVVKTLREKTQDIYLQMKEEYTKKIAEATTLVDATILYYTLNDLAGNWGVGASWTDKNGKQHDISSGKDLEYKIPSGKSLYVINYRTAGYRSRRMIYQTNCIHHDTLNGKGQYYWNSSKKNGQLTFFYCDLKGEETAKKIATKYCNENDCFAYLLVDANDHTKCNEGFDKLIEDVGADKFKNISDYKHLTQYTGTRKNTVRNSHGVVSDQDVFFVYGASSDAGSISNPYNDAQYLKTLTEDDLEDFLDSDEIVYVPILRYSSTENHPSITNISKLISDENAKNTIKKLFGSTKIYAIKTAFVEKLKNKGYSLIDFNTYFKSRLQTFANEFSELNKFNSLVEFCRKQFNDENRSGWGYCASAEKQFTHHMLNIFGLDYAKYIRNEKLVEAIDYCLIVKFFSETVHEVHFCIRRFNEKDYLDHMNNLLSKIGVSNFDSKSIRASTIQFNLIKNHIMNYLYSSNHEEFTKILNGSSSKDWDLPKVSTIRENVKAEVDKNPMIKYIMASHEVSGNLNDLGANKNMVSQFADSRNHYYNKDTWLSKMDDNSALLFRTQLSSLIG